MVSADYWKPGGFGYVLYNKVMPEKIIEYPGKSIVFVDCDGRYLCGHGVLGSETLYYFVSAGCGYKQAIKYYLRKAFFEGYLKRYLQAKTTKDFVLADRRRDRLAKTGVVVENLGHRIDWRIV